jgi:hypothetical protein
MNTVNYQMSFDELLRTCVRRKILRPRFLARLGIMLCCGIVLAICGGAWSYVGAIFIAFAILLPVFLYRAIRRLLTKYSWFTDPITLTFGDAGISVTATDFRSDLGWSRFRTWSQTDSYFFLFLDRGNVAVTIPKRAFSVEQLQSFLSYVTRIGA